jgi:DNA invertase Pin-like site-specific DNA recombinase
VEVKRYRKTGTTKRGNKFIIVGTANVPIVILLRNILNNAYKPEIRIQVLKMAVDYTGTRATGRILGISKDTVTAILKKTKNGLNR